MTQFLNKHIFAFLMLILLVVVFVFLMLFATIAYLVLPFVMLLTLHYLKIWKTKPRLIIGTIALVAGIFLMMAVLSPIITQEAMSSLSKPSYSTNSPDNVTSITVNPYISTSASSYTVTYISKLSTNTTFNISTLSSLDSSPVHLYNVTVPYSNYSKANYTFSLVLTNLTSYQNKYLIEINVTQNKSYTLMLGPILISKSSFQNMVSDVNFKYYVEPLSIYLFIFVEVLYVLLVFGAILTRRGRLGIGRSRTPPQ